MSSGWTQPSHLLEVGDGLVDRVMFTGRIGVPTGLPGSRVIAISIARGGRGQQRQA